MHHPVGRSDVRGLVDRGRRSGLNTRELYQALSSRQPRSGDQPAQVDANGFIPVMVQSHASFRPGSTHPDRQA
ncbi:MAG: hypothetical protein FJ271_26440 [Planctomycetes bacterium]|nr:hypothetical protein [Planctomycetota bacterium]